MLLFNLTKRCIMKNLLFLFFISLSFFLFTACDNSEEAQKITQDKQNSTTEGTAEAEGTVEAEGTAAKVYDREDEDIEPLSQADQLLLAAQSGGIEIVQRFISARAYLDVRDDKGWTPLHWASQANNIEIAQALLEAGATPNIKANTSWFGLKGGHTPLDLAKTEEMKTLLIMFLTHQKERLPKVKS